jgi:hypothetical protein
MGLSSNDQDAITSVIEMELQSLPSSPRLNADGITLHCNNQQSRQILLVDFDFKGCCQSAYCVGRKRASGSFYTGCKPTTFSRWSLTTENACEITFGFVKSHKILSPIYGLFV